MIPRAHRPREIFRAGRLPGSPTPRSSSSATPAGANPRAVPRRCCCRPEHRERHAEAMEHRRGQPRRPRRAAVPSPSTDDLLPDLARERPGDRRSTACSVKIAAVTTASARSRRCPTSSRRSSARACCSTQRPEPSTYVLVRAGAGARTWQVQSGLAARAAGCEVLTQRSSASAASTTGSSRPAPARR